jgi:hypothetical protein
MTFFLMKGITVTYVLEIPKNDWCSDEWQYDSAQSRSRSTGRTALTPDGTFVEISPDDPAFIEDF